MPLRVHHTNAARRDLRGIWSFIASDDPTAADGQLRRIGESIWHLSNTPQMGRARNDLAPELRSFPVGRYLVFFDFRRDDVAGGARHRLGSAHFIRDV